MYQSSAQKNLNETTFKMYIKQRAYPYAASEQADWVNNFTAERTCRCCFNAKMKLVWQVNWQVKTHTDRLNIGGEVLEVFWFKSKS